MGDINDYSIEPVIFRLVKRFYREGEIFMPLKHQGDAETEFVNLGHTVDEIVFNSKLVEFAVGEYKKMFYLDFKTDAFKKGDIICIKNKDNPQMIRILSHAVSNGGISRRYKTVDTSGNNDKEVEHLMFDYGSFKYECESLFFDLEIPLN